MYRFLKNKLMTIEEIIMIEKHLQTIVLQCIKLFKQKKDWEENEMKKVFQLFHDHAFPAFTPGKGIIIYYNYFPAFPAKFSKKPIFQAFPALLDTLCYDKQ